MLVRLTVAIFILVPSQLEAQSRASSADQSEQYSLWYAPPDSVRSPRFEWPTPNDASKVDRHLDELRRAYERKFSRLAKDPFVARVETTGARVLYASSFAPAMVIRGSAEAIDCVRALPGILRVWPRVTYVEETDSSRKTVRADASSAPVQITPPFKGRIVP